MNGYNQFNGQSNPNMGYGNGGYPNDPHCLYFSNNPNASFNFYIGAGSAPPQPQPQAQPPQHGFPQSFQAGGAIMNSSVNLADRQRMQSGNVLAIESAGYQNQSQPSGGYGVSQGRNVPHHQYHSTIQSMSPHHQQHDHIIFVVRPEQREQIVLQTSGFMQQQQQQSHSQPQQSVCGGAGGSAFTMYQQSSQPTMMMSHSQPNANSSNNVNGPTIIIRPTSSVSSLSSTSMCNNPNNSPFNTIEGAQQPPPPENVDVVDDNLSQRSLGSVSWGNY